MFKTVILSTIAAACLAAPAFAQAAPQEVELEGVFSRFNSGTNMMTVMGMRVFVPSTATVMTSSATRDELSISLADFLVGAALPGRVELGFINGTAKLLGTWNAADNRIDAIDVLVEPAENVALGVVTSNWCSTRNCDAATDYVRGPTGPGTTPGPAFLPIRERRMQARTIQDETGFPLDLTGVDLRGKGFAAEGYYGTAPSSVPTPSGGIGSELAFHYFIFDLIEPSPQFFLNKTAREISVLRTDCRTGERFEMTGHIHSRVNPNGTVNDPVRPNNGVVEVVYTQPNGTVVRRNTTATVLAANSPIGRFRARFDAPGGFCPTSVTVRWVPTANQANPTTIYASMGNVPVEVRTDDPADD